MKKLAFLSMLAASLFMGSCSKEIYSHDEVMQTYRTKEDVIKQFGQPDEILASVDTVQWLYNCSPTSNFAATGTKVKIGGTYRSSNQGRVLDWKSSGKNFAQRKGKTLVNVAIIVGSVAIAIVIISALAFDDMFDDFSTGLQL
jgi:hypothetical protein